MLSGFLITSLLLQEWFRRRSISLRDFYVRRVLRLGPALAFYLTALGLYAFAFLKKEHAQEIYTGILLTLSYVYNWAIALNPALPVSVLAITWSLAIEEQFYLVWPLSLTVLLCFRVSWRGTLLLLATGVVAVGLWRLFLWQSGASTRRIYYATDTHADGLLVGCLVAVALAANLVPRGRVFDISLQLLAAASMLGLSYLALAVNRASGVLYTGGFSLVVLAVGAILLMLSVSPVGWALRFLSLRPLAWVGRISYGLYLWHWPVRGLVFHDSLHPSIKQIGVAIILSFAAASFSFYFVEKPFLALKTRFSRAEAKAPYQESPIVAESSP